MRRTTLLPLLFLVALPLGEGACSSAPSSSDATGKRSLAAGSAVSAGETYALISVNSGDCLDVTSVSTAPGALLQQWGCSNGANQQWRLDAAPNGSFHLVSLNSGLCLDVSGVSQSPGAPVQQWSCWDGPNQRWRLEQQSNGAYELVSENSGLCLDVVGVSTSAGAGLQQWSCWHGANQQWRLQPVGASGGGGAPNGGGGGGPVASGVPVYTGGTYSAGDAQGMRDLAVPSNTANYRAAGGRLYVHELGWVWSSAADQAALASLFPDPPIWESSMPAYSHAGASLQNYAKPYWPHGVWAECVNFDTPNTIPTAQDMADLRAATAGMAEHVGPYFTPNDATSWQTPFGDPRWDGLRAVLRPGDALCIDSPPQFYWQMDPRYRQFCADEISWATAHGVTVVTALYPMESNDLWSDTSSCVADYTARGATPTAYAMNGYYGGGDPGEVAHPLGSENNPQDSDGTAYLLLKSLQGHGGGGGPAGGAFRKGGNNGTVSCGTFCGGSQWGAVGSCLGSAMNNIPCDLAVGYLTNGVQQSCVCRAGDGSTFTKGGNNGTVSCDTFCAGAQWGETGACVSSSLASNGNATIGGGQTAYDADCSLTPGYLTNGAEMTCVCSR